MQNDSNNNNNFTPLTFGQIRVRVICLHKVLGLSGTYLMNPAFSEMMWLCWVQIPPLKPHWCFAWQKWVLPINYLPYSVFYSNTETQKINLSGMSSLVWRFGHQLGALISFTHYLCMDGTIALAKFLPYPLADCSVTDGWTFFSFPGPWTYSHPILCAACFSH